VRENCVNGSPGRQRNADSLIITKIFKAVVQLFVAYFCEGQAYKWVGKRSRVWKASLLTEWDAHTLLKFITKSRLSNFSIIKSVSPILPPKIHDISPRNEFLWLSRLRIRRGRRSVCWLTFWFWPSSEAVQKLNLTVPDIWHLALKCQSSAHNGDMLTRRQADLLIDFFYWWAPQLFV